MKNLSEKYRGHTVSQGTLTDLDLLTSFADTLTDAENQGVEVTESVITYANELAGMLRNWRKSYAADCGKYFPSEESFFDFCENVGWSINENLYDELNRIAPIGTIFTSHPGDGLLFGFWDEELFQ